MTEFYQHGINEVLKQKKKGNFTLQQSSHGRLWRCRRELLQQVTSLSLFASSFWNKETNSTRLQKSHNSFSHSNLIFAPHFLLYDAVRCNYSRNNLYFIFCGEMACTYLKFSVIIIIIIVICYCCFEILWLNLSSHMKCQHFRNKHQNVFWQRYNSQPSRK